jgi:hypothetical protein
MVAINGSIKVDEFTLAELLAVKRFVDLVGSIEKARELLLAIAKQETPAVKRMTTGVSKSQRRESNP